MILKARKVRLKPKERMALEILCRTLSTPQRDARRARIVLLAAAGDSSRSIAATVGVRPNVASLWRNRFADQGLEGLKDKPRPGKKPIYGAKTGKRILALLDRPRAMRGGRGRCWPRRLAMSTCNTSGGFCAAT